MEQRIQTSLLRLLVGFGIVVLILLGSAIFSYHNTRQLREDSQVVERTYRILEKLESVYAAIVDAETGQRGFLLTGEEQYLQPYHSAITTINQEMSALESLTLDNPQVHSRLAAINEIIQEKLNELAISIRLRRNESFDAAVAQLREDANTRELEQLRLEMEGLQANEKAFLSARLAESQRSFRIAIISDLIATTLGLLAVGMLGFYAYQSGAEREIAAERLFQERGRLEVTLKSIGDGVMATDTQGRVAIMNPIAETLTGWKQAEALGQPLTKVFPIVHEITGDPIKNPALEALARGTGIELSSETLLVRKDSKRIPISDSAAPIRAGNGEVLGAVLVFRDVGEERDLQKELDFRNRLLTLTIEVGAALSEGDSFSDSLQRCCKALILHVEGAIARIWTFDPTSQLLILQASAGSALRPNDPHQEVEFGKFKIGRIAETRKAYQVNWLLGDPMFPDQEWVKQEGLVSFAGYPLIVDERLVGVMALYARHVLKQQTLEIMGAIAQEIAVGIDRRRAVSNDREIRHLLEVTLASIGDAVLTTDQQGNIAFLNQVAESLTGWKSEEAVGLSAVEVFQIAAEKGELPEEHPIQALLAGEPIADEARFNRLYCRGAGPLPVEYNGSPILSEREVVGVVLVFRDITERLANQLERESLLAQAENERLRLEAVLESLPAGVIIADENGHVTHLNGAAQNIWGANAPKPQGIERYDEWIGWWPETGQRIAAEEWAMARALSSGEVCPGEEVIIERFDGGKSIIINSASPIRDAEGRIVGGVVAELDITELSETQAALSDARSRLNSLLEAGEFGTWEWDVESDLFYADQNLESMFGVVDQTVEAISLASYLESVHEEDRLRVESTLRKTIETGRRLEVDYRILDSLGETHWVIARGRVEENSAGRPTRVAGMIIDVTERRKAEIALAESRQFLEETLDALPAHIAVINREGVILVVNRAWRDFVAANEYSETILGVGTNYLESCERSVYSDSWEEGSKAAQGIREVVDGAADIFEMEYPSHTPSEKKWFLMRVNRFESTTGMRVIVSHENITTRVLAEQSVRESEEKFRTLADNMSQFAWMTNPNGSIFWYNKRWFDYTGTTFEEMQGWGWTKVQHPDHVDRVVKKFKACWAKGELWEDTFPIRSKTGEYRWFLSRANPIYDDQGQIIRWFGTNTDITEHRELEQALLEVDQRKDQFLATLGHELRNPLAGILGGIAVLESSETNTEDRLEAQHIILRQSHFMERLIDDLLDVSRIVRGKISLKKEVVDVRRLVEEVTGDLRREFAEQELTLSCKLPDAPVFCRADRERIRQVFTNLLHNSKKFTQKGEVAVELEISPPGDQLCFRVADTGIGMTEETLRNIFDPFVQADLSLERSKGGLGLGLAIVQGMIELHGGKVAAHSKGIGHGSRFEVALPVLKDVVEEEAVREQRIPEKIEKQLTVLVVDDRRDASFAIVKFLEKAGHQVHTAEDGPSGVEAALQLQPDVIVCDIGLPGFDGYEVARQIRTEKSFAQTLMIAVTGYGQPQDKDIAKEAGFDCHLVKPVDRNALMRTIATWMA